MEPTKFFAIKALCPKAEFVLRGGVLEFVKANGDTKPTDSEIDAKLAELKTAYDSKKYQRDRAAEYPSYGEQLDYIYHNGLAKWKTDIVQPVKDKYPKGGS